MSGYLDVSELLDVFLVEADEQIQQLDTGILYLEKNPGDLDVINEVFRAAHTLKGSSTSMGLESIRTLTHAMESLLDDIRSGHQTITPAAINSLLKSIDVLRALIRETRENKEGSVNIDGALASLAQISDHSQELAGAELSTNTPLAIKPEDCVRITIQIADECVMPSVRGFMIFNALEDKAAIIASYPGQEQIDQLRSGGLMTIDMRPRAKKSAILSALKSICEIQIMQYEEAEPSQAQNNKNDKPSTQVHSIQTVRVGVDRLDTLMNLVGELVIDRTRVVQLEGELSARYEGDTVVSALAEAALHLGRMINELQEHIMKIRMLPVEQVFNRFPRMVRDLASNAHKDINFVISGQETELDRSILEDIVDPITHLLRNSVDHGIESPDERAASGKPSAGTIILSAKHEENHIVIEIEDDGRGINADEVKKSAIAKGAISSEAADRLSKKDALQLAFFAGVSTAKTITDVSGRGVGMDVVKNNIERLSGLVDIHTELGVGTRIALRLPLTLAIIQALIVSVQDRLFAIPLSAVVETTFYSKENIHYIGNRRMMRFRDSVIPFVQLQGVYKSTRKTKPRISKRSREHHVVVVIRVADQQVALGVDKLIGDQEVVIKSLGSYLGRVEGISGASLLGNGKIVLILDAAGFMAILERGNPAPSNT